MSSLADVRAAIAASPIAKHVVLDNCWVEQNGDGTSTEVHDIAIVRRPHKKTKFYRSRGFRREFARLFEQVRHIKVSV